MRRFEVWLDKGIPGSEPDTEIVELPDDVTPEKVDEECAEVLDTMIGNLLDTGWRELEPTEKKRGGRRSLLTKPAASEAK